MVEELERRAEAGEPDAQFALGLELLSAPGSAEPVARGTALVEAASAAGLAAATELCAIFEAMGIARPVNWDRAFDRVQLAAEQGSATAQTQLLLLADPSCDPILPADLSRGFWAEVRSRISFGELLRHGDRRSLSDAPRIRVIDGFLTGPECRWLIERARPRLQPATVIKTTGDQGVVHERSNSGTTFLVPDMDIVLEIVRNRIAAATRVPIPVFEPTQLLHYEVGQEFRPHHDYLDPGNPGYGEQLREGQRIATFLVFLNEDFEGGETDFPRVGLRYRGRRGDAIFWANVDMEGRPDPLTLHAGRPPTAGEKWILSQWIRDRAAASG